VGAKSLALEGGLWRMFYDAGFLDFNPSTQFYTTILYSIVEEEIGIQACFLIHELPGVKSAKTMKAVMLSQIFCKRIIELLRY